MAKAPRDTYEVEKRLEALKKAILEDFDGCAGYVISK
jgi:hypothetical protein